MHENITFKPKVMLMASAKLNILCHDIPVKCDMNSYTICAPTTVYGTVMSPEGELSGYLIVNVPVTS